MAIVTADQNVKFDGTLDDVVVLKQVGDDLTVVMWDSLSGADQALMTSIINDFGGDAPLAADTSGFAVVNFGGSVVGASATGLDNVATATSGTATVDLGAAKSGGDASGLVSVSGSTAGYQVVTIAPTFASGATATGLTDDVPASSGTATVSFDVVPATTLLAADTYDFDVTFDGGSLQQLSITTTGGETYAALAGLMATAVGVSGTVTFTTDTFTVTSASTGTASTVVVAAGTLGSVPGGDLFAALEAADTSTATFGTPAAGTDLVSAPTYTATIVVDGVSKAISVVGSAAQTVTDLLAEINTDLGSTGTASLSSGSIKVTSATVGNTSTVDITDVDLFSSLTGTSTVGTAVDGTDGAGGDVTYHAIVEVDGVPINVAFLGTNGDTVADVITEIDNDLGAAASVALTGGDIVITSATTGRASKVRIFDTGLLFARLTGYTGMSTVDGVAPRVYTASVAVDGVANAVSVQGSDAQTFTDLVAEINTDLSGATAAIDADGNITITSASTGITSTVGVTVGNLFGSCAGFKGGVRVVDGAADLVAVFTKLRMPNGTTALEYFPHKTVGLKPADNTPYTPIKNPEFRYYGGSPADWRYMNDDTVI